MGFLEEVVDATCRSVSGRDYGSDVPARPRERPLSFRDAVTDERGAGALVVEYKRVSPGYANPTLPFRSVDQFLSATRSAQPTAYSCLATAPRFEGSPRDVAELARSTDRPVLFKDFVLHPRQVEVAARTGASAILLIARLGESPRLAAPLATLADAAHRHHLEVLLEFHDRAELSQGADVPADVFGVNSRDLDTLRIDRPTAVETLREAGRMGLRPLLGLSGVETVDDARRYWAAGADGILVGTAVARSPEPAEFLRTLRRAAPGALR